MRKRTITIIFLIFVLFFSYGALKLALNGKEFAFERQISGCILAAKPRGYVFSSCTGYKNLDKKTPPNINSQFMIGSVSKQFTAVALLLALNDKFKNNVMSELNKPLSHYLPPSDPFWNGDMPKWANTITLHQLLSHTSGIPDYYKTKKFKSLESNNKYFYENPHKPYKIINLVKHLDLLPIKQDIIAYSNTNYVLLAVVIERLTHKSYDKYLQEKIFKPFKLKNTFSTSQYNFKELKSIDTKITDQLQYDPKTDKQMLIPPEKYFHLSNAFGTANIISTPSDLIKWFKALHENKSVLPENLYRLMQEKHTKYEGYSNKTTPSLMGEMYGYGGRIGTYTTLLLYIPKKQLSLVMMTNILEDPEKTKDWMGYRVISKVYNKYIRDEFQK